MEQIMQKEIEIPCIFGDRNIILKSLENERGAIKLPLYILTSKGIQVDTKRQADLHLDIFYQQDQSFSKLPQDHPLYRPYNLKKRRGLPITINYSLTMITKYKEDLDQMCTNWMVHWRPDIYVKWWHPRNKIEPLQSEILWGQSIDIEANEDFDVTRRFKWQASTNFTFKSWIFPGLNYEEDSFAADEEEYNRTHEALIEHINVYSTVPDFDNVDIDEEGFPVLGDLFEQTDPQNSTQIGMYAVPTSMDMDTADAIVKNRQKIRRGETDDLEDVSVSGTYNDQPELAALSNTNGTVQRDPVERNKFTDVKEVYNKYAQYILMPPINNDIIQMKYVYFFGGATVSAMESTPMSGDILFHNFSKDFKHGDRDFGDAYSDQMIINFNYDIANKIMTIVGRKETDNYISLVGSRISDKFIKQKISLQGKQAPIKLDINRGLTFNQNTKQYQFDQTNKELNYTDVDNIAVWNDIFCKRQHMHNMGSDDWQLFENMTAKKNYTYDIKFKIQTDIYQSKLNGIKKMMDGYNQKLELRELSKHKYKIVYSDLDFWKVLNHWDIAQKEFCNLIRRKVIEQGGVKYSILANNNIYIVIKSTQEEDQLYDYGVTTLPVFDTYPIFNVMLKDHQVVYGLGTQYYIGGK